MAKYVCGFVNFQDEIIFIHKARGKHKDQHNGLGGKVEPGESVVRAMQREAFEEAGIVLSAKEIELKVVLKGQSNDQIYEIYFFLCTVPVKEDLKSSSEGQVKWFKFGDFPPTCVHNLHWLVPLCMSTGIRHPVELYTLGKKGYTVDPFNE